MNPTQRLSPKALEQNLSRLRTLEDRFNQRLIGQPEAVRYVTHRIQRIVTGFVDWRTPLGVWLFAGTTGVGKTEMAKMVAEELDWPIYRYDMSEFQHDHTVARLIGAPPGYRNSGTGELIESIQKHPYSVLLFDEIEKAHAQITQVFLQLFGEGRITDSMGHTVETKNIIVIMTTNLGAQYLYKKQKPKDVQEKLKHLFIEKFSSELFGRIHKMIVFNPLHKKDIEIIARDYFSSLISGLEQVKYLKFSWNANIIVPLIKNHNDIQVGARGIHRLVHEDFFEALTNHYVAGTIKDGNYIQIEIIDQQFRLTVIGNIPVPPYEEAKTEKPSTMPPQLLQKGIVTLDQRGMWPHQFVGRYASRRIVEDTDFEQGYVYQIIKVFDDKIIAERLSRKILGAQYIDQNWTWPTPMHAPLEFFQNLCLELSNPAQQRKALEAVKKLFEYATKLSILYTANPLDEIETLLRSDLDSADHPETYKRRIECVEILKSIFGSFCVEEIFSETAKEAKKEVHRYYKHYTLPRMNSKL